MAKNDALFRPYRTKVCFRNFFLFSPSTLPFNLFASSSRNSERRRQRRRHKMYRICTNEATTQSVKRREKNWVNQRKQRLYPLQISGHVSTTGLFASLNVWYKPNCSLISGDTPRRGTCPKKTNAGKGSELMKRRRNL